ncbi:hypothetical protein DOZ80_28765 [Pseudomonas fluorescens]|uniref:Uncharacterized protein n=1 Tax=Pseudomonas fluorescens TaxID=294 RepID=A0A327MKY3_PSEFL|nr:hypothetical protein DOZ80_28765 [Pseudomonas fluorescens]
MYISISAVTAAGGFALTASPFFKRQKGTKRLRPGVRHLAKARCSLATVSIRGHRLRSASRRPPLDVFDFVERRYAPPPDEHLRSACRRGERSKARSKAKAKAKARRPAGRPDRN